MGTIALTDVERPSPVVGYLLVAAQMKKPVSEADKPILCWLSLTLASLLLSSLLLLLLLPMLKVEPVFLSFHRGLGTTMSRKLPGIWHLGIRLGLLRHSALWTE